MAWTLLFAACGFVIVVLLKLLRQKRLELHYVTRLYANLAGTTGFDNIIKILTDEIRERGIKVIDFYRKNRVTKMLEGDEGSIPLLEKSTAVKAFFTMSPAKLGAHCEIDRELAKKLGTDTVFIPIHMESEEPCWKTNCCGSRECAAYNNRNCTCWLHSGKTYRGVLLATHREKTAKCLSCRAFLPVGVFAVQGKKIRGTHNFINSHFSGALKNSVLYERAVYSASMDGLTNVFNRRSMEEQLLRSFKLSGKYNHPLSLCMLDIDHFKRFNDTHGHQAGDLVLRETADLISGLIREVDILARYGGEEFCIIFPHTDKALAFEVAERIRAEVENHEFSAGRRITISMGIANHPDDEVSSPQDLVKKADVALYHSKISRNTVAAYRQEFQDPVKGRFND